MSTTITKEVNNNLCNGLNFEPKKWKEYSVESTTNCYIYALNLPMDPYTGSNYISWDYIQPGRLGGNIQIKERLHCPFKTEVVIDAVKKDLAAIGMEIVESTFDEVREGNWWKVALVFDNSTRIFSRGDYHWYRQNMDGTWSHKQGNGPVRNTDDSDKVITNQETCDRGRYTVFAGYYMIRKKRGRKPKSFKAMLKKIAGI